MSNAKGCGLAVAIVIAAWLVMMVAAIALNWDAPPKTVASAPDRAPARITGKWSRTPDSSYTVRAGDTLSKIAAAHGTTVGSLMEANGLTNADVIEVGEQLLVKGAGKTPPSPRRGPATAPRSWQTITFTDEWGEPAGKGAVSRWTAPAQAMSFPYGRIRARLMVGSRCRPFLRFTETPNLSGGQVGRGHRIHRLPARWNDGETFTVELRHRPGSKDLSFSSGHIYLHELAENQTLGLALDWYREDYVAWRFDLDGVGEALADVGCG